MGRFGRLARGTALAAAAVGIVVLPSVAAAQNGPTQGTLTVDVVLTGDPGGDPSAVSLLIERNTGTGGNETVVTAPGAASQSFQLDPGSYVITASTADAAYAITATTCDSQPGAGPNTADFIIDGPGEGGDGDASCVVSATYTAPPPTEPTVPEPTVPEPTDPVVTTTTVDQGGLPPSGGGSPSPTIPVTGSTDETLAIALTALGALALGGGALSIARRR